MCCAILGHWGEKGWRGWQFGKNVCVGGTDYLWELCTLRACRTTLALTLIWAAHYLIMSRVWRTGTRGWVWELSQSNWDWWCRNVPFHQQRNIMNLAAVLCSPMFLFPEVARYRATAAEMLLHLVLCSLYVWKKQQWSESSGSHVVRWRVWVAVVTIHKD